MKIGQIIGVNIILEKIKHNLYTKVITSNRSRLQTLNYSRYSACLNIHRSHFCLIKKNKVHLFSASLPNGALFLDKYRKHIAIHIL